MDNHQLSPKAEPPASLPPAGISFPRRVADASRRHALILLGIGASVSYGLWAFLEKLTQAQSPAIINVIVYGTAFVLSLAGLRHFRPPTATAVIAGVAGGAINAIVLVMLQRHALTLVFPFVSIGGVFFIAFSFLLVDEHLRVRSKTAFWSGVVTTLAGMALCGVGIAGGLQRVVTAAGDLAAFCMAVLISILTGLWLLFAYLTIVRNRYEPLIATTWVFFGSFAVSLIVIWLTSATTRIPTIGQTSAIAALAGVFMFLGELATYHGFAAATEANHRAEHVLTGLLANSELLPVLILSQIVFHDVSFGAAIGCVLVLIGIGVLNSARQ